jgi:hypothetical protein
MISLWPVFDSNRWERAAGNDDHERGWAGARRKRRATSYGSFGSVLSTGDAATSIGSRSIGSTLLWITASSGSVPVDPAIGRAATEGQASPNDLVLPFCSQRKEQQWRSPLPISWQPGPGLHKLR